MKFLVVGKKMLKFQYPVEQQYEVEEWMVEIAMDQMKWMMMMKEFHYQTLQVSSLLFFF